MSARNRLPQLKAALESIRSKEYADTEVIVIDDGSTDGTWEYLETQPWVSSHFTPRDGGYRLDPASLFNGMMMKAAGDVLIQQSAEVLHLTPVARQLVEACESHVPAFATVLSGEMNQVPQVQRAVEQGWHLDGYEWGGMDRSIIDPDGRRPDGGEGTARPPASLIVGGERVDAYTSVDRPVPFFFCGAILRQDWIDTGGYPLDLHHGASDLHFGFRMLECGFRFRFLGGAIAFHLAHEKT